MIERYALIAALALMWSAAVWAFGYDTGRSGEKARNLAAVAALEDRLQVTASEARRAAHRVIAAEEEARRLAMEAEHEARNDPDADRPAIGPDSVSRIFRR